MSPSIIKAIETTHGAGERIDETSQELTRPEGLLAAAMLDRSMVRVSRVSTSSTEFVWENISKNLHYDEKRWMSLWISFRKL